MHEDKRKNKNENIRKPRRKNEARMHTKCKLDEVAAEERNEGKK
jgi:hypothetical protein